MNYDITGDIRGRADALEGLLAQLGYRQLNLRLTGHDSGRKAESLV